MPLMRSYSRHSIGSGLKAPKKKTLHHPQRDGDGTTTIQGDAITVWLKKLVGDQSSTRQA
jgi:hypothetical protein